MTSLAFWRWPLFFFGVLLALVSALAAGLFWSSVPASVAGQFMAWITSISLEGTKYFFPAITLVLWRAKRTAVAALFGALSVALLLVSVAGTMGFLENAAGESLQSAEVTSLVLEQRKKQLASIDQQTETGNQ
ncbi:MAG: hypothetical protein HUJ30_00720, partial [Gammaproteobacteria bacterium]|nr:hypothetical protein [Gammaproteobacteria bacterium]